MYNGNSKGIKPSVKQQTIFTNTESTTCLLLLDH